MIKTTGTVKEILEELKKLSNPNCNKCYGRGHIGYREKEIKNNNKVVKPREYIICPKCAKKI